jgi:hypothetical protein
LKRMWCIPLCIDDARGLGVHSEILACVFFFSGILLMKRDLLRIRPGSVCPDGESKRIVSFRKVVR